MADGSGQQQAYVIQVEITYCDKNGKVWWKKVDMQKCGGLYWWCPDEQKDLPEVPAELKSQLGTSSGSPPGINNTCYWNGSEWICPME